MKQLYCQECRQEMPHFSVGLEEDHRFECDSCGAQQYVEEKKEEKNMTEVNVLGLKSEAWVNI